MASMESENLIHNRITYPIEVLLYKLKHNEINIDPEYQRRVVWNRSDQSHLIESIMRGYPIPPLYLNLDDTGKYECVDGKQRLTTIRNFEAGKVVYENDENERMYYKDLGLAEKSRFNQTNIDIIRLSKWPKSNIIDLFQRIQFGKTLSTSERIHGLIDSELVKFINKSNIQLLSKRLEEFGVDNNRYFHYSLFPMVFSIINENDYRFCMTTPSLVKYVDRTKEDDIEDSSLDLVELYITKICSIAEEKCYTFKKNDVVIMAGLFNKLQLDGHTLSRVFKKVVEKYYKISNKLEEIKDNNFEDPDENLKLMSTQWFDINRLNVSMVKRRVDDVMYPKMRQYIDHLEQNL